MTAIEMRTEIFFLNHEYEIGWKYIKNNNFYKVVMKIYSMEISQDYNNLSLLFENNDFYYSFLE